MRITGGQFKGRKVPSGFATHVRPSTDFMRESLFNLLTHRYPIEDSVVLDLFSGSGIVSLEFLSRDCKTITAVDRDPKNTKIQKQAQAGFETPHWNIITTDVFKFLKTCDPLSFDFIFADPPYDLPEITSLPEKVLPLLSENGVFILEHRSGMHFNTPPTFDKRYGETHLSFFEKG